jgi:hypothetical protein
MRTLTAPTLAALAGSTLPIGLLVEMDLTIPLYLNSANIDLTLAFNGTTITYIGTKGLGKVEAIRETPAEVAQLRFELSGVPATSIALALAEPVQGKAVRIKRAVFDPATYQLLDVRLRWAGTLDVMSISDGPGAATISVTAEHAGIDLLRPVTSLYTQSDQQRQAPGDLAFQFVSDQADMRVVWPAASWGRQ